MRSSKSQLAATGGLIALGGGTAAQAQVSVFTPSGTDSAGNEDFISWNPYGPETSGYADIENLNYIGTRVCNVSLNTPSSIDPYSVDGKLTILAEGTAINSSGTFGEHTDWTYLLPNNTDADFETYSEADLYDVIMGYRIANAGTPGGYDYGWVQFDYIFSTKTIHLDSWAIEVGGDGILSGTGTSAVPEPSTFASLGGLAVLLYVIGRKHFSRRRPTPKTVHGIV